MRFRLIDSLVSLRRLMESTWLLLWHLYVILMKARTFSSSVIVILTSTLCVGTFVHEDFEWFYTGALNMHTHLHRGNEKRFVQRIKRIAYCDAKYERVLMS